MFNLKNIAEKYKLVMVELIILYLIILLHIKML